MTEFRYPDAIMARILDGCRTGQEWWVWHPVHPVQVSNLGRVRDARGRLRKPQPGGSGDYPTIIIDGKSRRVHHLVLESYVGDRPDGEQCRHFDDNPQNNLLNNLFWGTQLENMADRRRNNRQRKIEQQRHAQAVLSRADRPDRQQIARQLAVLEKLEQLATR